MFKNPYSPVFGGRPTVFFGRKNLLERFALALVDASSEDRALFVTGTRGCGKTALLERLSSIAANKDWMTIDLGPDRPARALLHQLTGYVEKTTTLDPQVSISIMGSGSGVSGRSTSKTDRPDEADLARVFLDACEQHPGGIAITIDEIQKVDERDISLICNAFQLASRKGKNAILVVAGLPYAHERVIQYEGCTYMRRAHHVELGLLSKEEANQALGKGLEVNPGLTLKQGMLEILTRASYGHPYMLQLLGYYLINMVNTGKPSLTHQVSEDELEEALRFAVLAFESRSLHPLVSELTNAERSYLVAMSQTLDEERVARTAEVAMSMGKAPSGVSYVRDSLVSKGIVVPAGHGLLMFNVPYLASYVLKDGAEGSNLRRLREWGV